MHLKITEAGALQLTQHLASSTPPSKSTARKYLAESLADRATLLAAVATLREALAPFAVSPVPKAWAHTVFEDAAAALAATDPKGTP
jgi:hypothetical protein